ncbi:hypothetical protein I316_02047 [Kwoniella heveanensis BCC8398]|uniref:Uncharacterized protein n=1 Tax=Kwoniella heveanensis BCC8398 TaxID=1296120 RepID=A0A1B9GYX1_9TREE|nr:hypothetical protein I316_02047 [Kwoniella heveanensis BCC8398]
MVMTPDTPSFELAPLEIMLSGKKSLEDIRSQEGSVREEDVAWTEDEEGLLQSYLAHPPRALRTAYPPGTLPPPGALDEITTQLISHETHKSPPLSTMYRSEYMSSSSSSGSDITPVGPTTSWRHSWSSTRQKLFNLARKESMESTGGHRRKESDSMIPSMSQLQLQEPAEDAKMKPTRPRVAVLGGQKMNRQQHSMDSLYGDEQPQTFSEALRLSSTLQVNAQGEGSVLTSGSGLSSPLAFSFNFNPLTSKKPFPFCAPSTYLPRPSLLQRGRSFTSEDFAREQAKANGEYVDEDYAVDDVDHECRPQSPQIRVRPDMHRSVSSPASTLHSSPPSSISSKSEVESDREMERPSMLEVKLNLDDEPITPVSQTFSSLGLGPGMGIGGPLGSQCSTPTVSSTPLNPPPIVQPPSATAPAITFTVNSPERERDKSTSTSTTATIRRPAGPGSSPSEAFASLSLSASSSLPLALPFTSSSPMTMRAISSGSGLGLGSGLPGGVKRSLRPTPLHRSLSESNTSARALGGLAMTSLSAERDRETKRQRAMGIKFGPAAGLSVIVPKRAGGVSDELRSPFEIKRAL